MKKDNISYENLKESLSYELLYSLAACFQSINADVASSIINYAYDNGSTTIHIQPFNTDCKVWQHP